MRDIILIIVVIAYMIGGYFIVGKISAFIDSCYKEYDYDIESDEENN